MGRSAVDQYVCHVLSFSRAPSQPLIDFVLDEGRQRARSSRRGGRRYDVGGLEAYAPTFASVVALPIARDDDLRTVVPRATAMVRIRSIFIGCCSQAPSRSRVRRPFVRQGRVQLGEELPCSSQYWTSVRMGLFVVPSPRVDRRVSITFCKVSRCSFLPALHRTSTRHTYPFARFSAPHAHDAPKLALAAGSLEPAFRPSRSTCSGIADRLCALAACSRRSFVAFARRARSIFAHHSAAYSLSFTTRASEHLDSSQSRAMT